MSSTSASRVLSALPASSATLYITALLLLVAPLLRLLYLIFLRPHLSPLRKVNGPPRKNLIFGAKDAASLENRYAALREWRKLYGHVYATPGLFGANVLVIEDHKALSHIFTARPYAYGMSDVSKRFLGMSFGDGVLTASGHQHKVQRRVLSPAFSQARVNELVPAFRLCALELNDKWSEMLEKSGTEKIEVNAHQWLSRVTFDVIGLGGFGHSFHTVSEPADLPTSTLASAFRTVFALMHGKRIMWLQAVIPILGWLPSKWGAMVRESKKVVYVAIREMVRSRKEAVVLEKGNVNIKKGDIDGKDVLSSLVKANMAEDLKPGERLSDEEVKDNTTLLMAAGHETTSNALSFCLWQLAMDEEMQDKLRAELRSSPSLDARVPAGECTAESLANLTYLDGVVKETLRLHPAGPTIQREAYEHDVLPLSKPICLVDGCSVDRLHISKGDEIIVPVCEINRATDIWGQDAEEFKPLRWAPDQQLPDRAKMLDGWNHLSTFGHGVKACLGMKFAALELKVVIATIIHDFKVTPTSRTKDVERRVKLVTKPYLKGDDSGPQMPVFISRAL